LWIAAGGIVMSLDAIFLPVDPRPYELAADRFGRSEGNMAFVLQNPKVVCNYRGRLLVDRRQLLGCGGRVELPERIQQFPP
jgi:hypothetical protein